MNANVYVIEDYENEPPSGSKKTNPIQTQSNPIAERVKLMQSVYLQRIMKKNAAKGYEKTKPKQTQFKPNQTQFPRGQNELKIACRKIRPHLSGLSEILLRLKPTVAFISNNYSPKPVSAIPGKEARQNAAKQVRQRKKVRILSHIPPNFELKNGSGFGLQGFIAGERFEPTIYQIFVSGSAWPTIDAVIFNKAKAAGAIPLYFKKVLIAEGLLYFKGVGILF